jgi:hypothetical protein
MSAWAFLLADQIGNPVAELATGAGRSLTFTRNAYPEATVTISHDDPAASVFFDTLRNGTPTLRAYRDGVLRFHGELAPFTETLEETAQLGLLFRGPFVRLIGYGQSRGRFTVPSVGFTATDAGQIAKALIDALPEPRIATTGTIEASKVRDRTYQFANVGQAITNLTRVLDGFDFEVTPIEYAGGNIGQFNVYASQGSDRSSTVLFQYGPETVANVREVTRQIEPPINYARVLGSNGQYTFKEDTASQAKYGRWSAQESLSDVSEIATLADKAQALLRPDPIKVVAFTPDPTLAPLPWDDYWLGDTVSFFGRRGAFVEDVTARINKITVVVDDEGNEAAAVEQPGTDGDTITSGVEVETGV